VIFLYRRRWGLLYLPVLATAGLAIWTLAHTLLTLPPRTLALAVGVPQGGYAQAGERYRAELERLGIRVELITTEPGALGPLQRLANPRDPAEAGFAHGLLVDRGPEAPVHALAVVGRQPLWIFTWHAGVQQLGNLRGLRVAVGPDEGPTREIAEQLLTHAQVPPREVQWVPLQGLPAAHALIEHQVDAIVGIGSSDAPSVRLLTRTPGISILGLERANALAAREPRLQPFVLPQGAIELRGDVPPRDLALLSTGTHLLVRETMHPALQRALLDAATDIHGTPSFLQQQAEFPDFQTDFPLSPVARRYALGDRPALETVLPYWWAQLAALLLFGVVPVLVAALLALMWIPRFFSGRVNAVLAGYYGELKFLEQELDTVSASPITLMPLLQRLDRMEAEVARLELPDRYADRWYTLREHLGAARERLLKMRGR
jgi:hypothetical protein